MAGFAGTIGARGADFSGLNRSFDRIEDARQANMRNALAQRQLRAEQQARELQQALAERQMSMQERQFGQGNQLDLMRFEEGRRQFDVGQGLSSRSLDLEDAYRQAQLAQSGGRMAEEARQFNEQLGQRRSEFGATLGQQQAEQAALERYRTNQLGEAGKDRELAERGQNVQANTSKLNMLQSLVQQAVQSGQFGAANALARDFYRELGGTQFRGEFAEPPISAIEQEAINRQNRGLALNESRAGFDRMQAYMNGLFQAMVTEQDPARKAELYRLYKEQLDALAPIRSTGGGR